MDLLLSDAADEVHLRDELQRGVPGSRIDAVSPGVLAVQGLQAADLQPPIVFARQILPQATFESATSIRGWSELLLDRIIPAWSGDHPWRLHLAPRYGRGSAGVHRCELIRKSLIEELGKKRRSLKRTLTADEVTYRPNESLVQLLLTSPDTGFLSIAAAPQPHRLRHRLAPCPFGEIPVASDKSAPSRAFAKLLEAEQRLGLRIEANETCVDLGACPGSWSYVALARGARVTAVDRSPLRDDLMENARLTFVRGDAFRFEPPQLVDWLLCDVIAAPERNIGLVLNWLKKLWCRRFVVTIKFKGADEYSKLDQLKAELPGLTGSFLLTRLCANHNEACVAGTGHSCP